MVNEKYVEKIWCCLLIQSKGGAVSKKSEPKPMIDNPNASATKSTSLPKPVPVKVNTNEVSRGMLFLL